jgi:hypothetical protein
MERGTSSKEMCCWTWNSCWSCVCACVRVGEVVNALPRYQVRQDVGVRRPGEHSPPGSFFLTFI